jgi:hypothetical protein
MQQLSITIATSPRPQIANYSCNPLILQPPITINLPWTESILSFMYLIYSWRGCLPHNCFIFGLNPVFIIVIHLFNSYSALTVGIHFLKGIVQQILRGVNSKIALSDQNDFAAFFRLRKMTCWNFINSGIR